MDGDELHLQFPKVSRVYIGKSQKETIFNIWRNEKYFFSFAYLSAVWLLFGQNPIEIIRGKIFVLDFAKIVTKELIDKQN